MRKLKSKLHMLMGEKKSGVLANLRREGITRKTLTRIYNDEANQLDFHTITTLCEYFQCDIGDLLYFEENEGD